LIEKLRGFHGS
jgi:hypothetical protein